MINWLKNITGKDFAVMITSVGGVFLAAFLSYVLFKILTNHLTHINSSIEKQTDMIDKLDKTLENNTAVISTFLFNKK